MTAIIARREASWPREPTPLGNTIQPAAGKAWIGRGSTSIRISRHDAHRIELRMVGSWGNESGPQVTDCFWFFPRQVVGSDVSRLAKDLLERQRGYVRFEAPVWSLADLVRAEPGSPIGVLARAIAMGDAEAQGKAVRLVGAVLTDAVRREVRELRHRGRPAVDWDRQAGLLLVRTAAVARQVHALRHQILTGDPVFELVDTYLDHEFQTLAGKLIAEAPATVRARFAMRANRLEAHFSRGGRGRLRALDGLALEEARLHHSVAKKVVYSDLYIDQATTGTRDRATEAIAGLAAALAMTFAVLVGLISSFWWPIGSVPFLALAILAYIVKDRIKERIRRRGDDLLRDFIPDRASRLQIVDAPTSLGVIRESVRPVAITALAPDIRACRRAGDRHGMWMIPDGERVARYRREWIPSTQVPRDHAGRRLVGILRFDLGSILNQLDDPYRVMRVPGTDDVDHLAVPRIYEAYLVVRTRDPESGSDLVAGVRIVIDQGGIRRVEDDGANSHPSM